MLKNFSLKTKIIGAITISSVFLCIVVSIVVYFYLERNLLNDKLSDINKLDVEQVHESEKIFEKGKLFAKVLSSDSLVTDYLLKPTEKKKNELLNILSEHTKEDNRFMSLYLLNKKGIAVISTDPTFIDQDYSFRDYYKDGINGKPTVDLLLGKTSNKFGYYFSYPVFDGNKNVLGVFVSKINSEEVDTAILNSEVSRESTVMLVDKYGIVIVSNRAERFLKSLGKLSEDKMSIIKNSKKFLDKEINQLQYDQAQAVVDRAESVSGIRFNDKEDGETEILNVNKIGEFPFYIISETGLETVRDRILNVVFILLGLMVLGIIISAFVIYRLILISISPIKELELFAQNISNGNFSKKIEIKRKDEFGNLANVFNKMAEDLEDLYKNLEKKVKERTEKFEESENNLKKSLSYSERINKLMVGRELEMIKLKKELNELKNK